MDFKIRIMQILEEMNTKNSLLLLEEINKIIKVNCLPLEFDGSKQVSGFLTFMNIPKRKNAIDASPLALSHINAELEYILLERFWNFIYIELSSPHQIIDGRMRNIMEETFFIFEQFKISNENIHDYLMMLFFQIGKENTK